MKETWDERYKALEYVYGTEPNAYFKEQIEKLPVGSILLPAEGEGRNAVYAAKLGWDVFAFDQSSEGQKKAFELASQNNVVINYNISEFSSIQYSAEQFNAIGLIYAHFDIANKETYYKLLDKYLAVGGIIIFEAFSKNHYKHIVDKTAIGGPKDINMLFSIDEIKSYFPSYEIIELYEANTFLDEGLLHKGNSSVIRFVGRKNKTAIL